MAPAQHPEPAAAAAPTPVPTCHDTPCPGTAHGVPRAPSGSRGIARRSRRAICAGLGLLLAGCLVLLVIGLAQFHSLRWYRYAAEAMDSVDMQARMSAAMEFNFNPANKGAELRELHQLVWKNVLFTGSGMPRRAASAHLAQYTGAEGVTAASCLLTVLIHHDPPAGVRTSASTYLIDLYLSDDPRVKSFITRKLVERIRAGDGRARFLLEHVLGEPALVPREDPTRGSGAGGPRRGATSFPYAAPGTASPRVSLRQE